MIDEWWLGFDPRSSQDAFPLYYASLGGLYDVAEHLVGKHLDQINAMGGRMGTPLVAALRGKHFEVAELLYRNGADVNVRDSGARPTRHCVNHTGPEFWTPAAQAWCDYRCRGRPGQDPIAIGVGGKT